MKMTAEMYKDEEKQHSKLKNLNLIILDCSTLLWQAVSFSLDILFDILTQSIGAFVVKEHCKYQIHGPLTTLFTFVFGL